MIDFGNEQLTKYLNGLIVVGMAGTTYLLTNHLHLFEPSVLPNTWIDTAIPLIPATIWMYVSYFLIFLLAYVLQPDLLVLKRYLAGVMFLNLFSCLIFIVYPTTFDRSDVIASLLNESVNKWNKWGFDLIYLLDSPANCFPSLHVSIAFLSAFILKNRHKMIYFGFILWATLISISTLTTKQHYFIDIVAGVITAGTAYWLFFVKSFIFKQTGTGSEL